MKIRILPNIFLTFLVSKTIAKLPSAAEWNENHHQHHGYDTTTDAAAVSTSHTTSAAHMVKNKVPLPESSTHEHPPRVDAFPSDNLPHLVHKRGPLTKKILAVGSHFPNLDFSMQAWKFADGTVEGVMEEQIRGTGQVLVKVKVDCLKIEEGRGHAIVGGAIDPMAVTNKRSMGRAFVVLMDDDHERGQHASMSSLLVNLPKDATCESLSKQLMDDNTNLMMTTNVQQAMVCNRSNGNQAWIECLERNKKEDPYLENHLLIVEAAADEK